MDPELPGSEKPGAIYEYIESKKDKKKIFNTELFADRYKSGVNINNNDINRDELDMVFLLNLIYLYLFLILFSRASLVHYLFYVLFH